MVEWGGRMEKNAENLFQARITVPGGLFVALIIFLAAAKLNLFGQTDPSEVKKIISEIDGLKALLALLGGGALLVGSGQVISAITTLLLILIFRSSFIRKRFGFYDTFFMSVEDANKNDRLKAYSAPLTKDSDTRLLINFLTQIDLSHEKEIQGWVSRRWYAANVYFGCAVALILAAATSFALFGRCPPSWILGAFLTVAIFPAIVGFVLRAEVVWMVRYIFDHPPTPKEPGSKSHR
jgi:hypothetical protein